MSDSKEILNTQTFAEKMGVSTSTVSKWLRDGKIQGKKVNNRWTIPADQLTESLNPAPAPATTQSSRDDNVSKTSKPASGPDPHDKPKRNQRFSIQEFSKMTYLTEFGVEKWLKEGRLKGSKDSSGAWSVDAGNIDLPDVQRLLRK